MEILLSAMSPALSPALQPGLGFGRPTRLKLLNKLTFTLANGRINPTKSLSCCFLMISGNESFCCVVSWIPYVALESAGLSLSHIRFMRECAELELFAETIAQIAFTLLRLPRNTQAQLCSIAGKSCVSDGFDIHFTLL